MVLADTSIWVDYLREGDDALVELLKQNQVLIHPMVIGELACLNLRNRNEILTLLGSLPAITQVSNAEVLYFLERNNLMGKGFSFVDLHLLAATALSVSASLWTRDRQLQRIAGKLGLA